MSLEAPPPTTRWHVLLYCSYCTLLSQWSSATVIIHQQYGKNTTFPTMQRGTRDQHVTYRTSPYEPAISLCIYSLCISCSRIILYRGDKRNFVHWGFFSWSIYLSPCSMRGLFYLPWHVRCVPDLVKSDQFQTACWEIPLWTMNYERSLAHQASPRST